MCSESNSPLVTSPRISFSHDLGPEFEGETESESSVLMDDSNRNQFDFSFSDGFVNESCSADELFSDGLIRPLQLQEKFVVSKHGTLPLQEKLTHSFTNGEIVSKHCPKQDGSEEIIVSSVIESEQKHQSKSFWRSSSVHCDNSYKKSSGSSSFWSLPLMSRSNSTGSVPSPRQVLKENKKQNSSPHKQVYQSSQKPPLKKNYGGGSYGNGVWINPALNVQPPYIAKGTANLFGLTSLFRDKKDKKNKK